MQCPWSELAYCSYLRRERQKERPPVIQTRGLRDGLADSAELKIWGIARHC